MEYMTPKEAAEKWGITERRAQGLCTVGKVKGAARLGIAWAIPKDAQKPKMDAIKRTPVKRIDKSLYHHGVEGQYGVVTVSVGAYPEKYTADVNREKWGDSRWRKIPEFHMKNWYSISTGKS